MWNCSGRVSFPRFFARNIIIFFVIVVPFFISSFSFGYKIKGYPLLVVVSPRNGAVLCEGRTYVIKWKSKNIKRLCIEPLIGGHPAGLLDNCDIDASKGEFLWHIPKGFVSGFGVNNSKVRIYLCNEKETYCRFRDVIVKSICVNPIKIRPKPLE